MPATASSSRPTTTRTTFLVLGVVVAVLAGFIAYEVSREPKVERASASTSALREDSHVLDVGPEGGATLVEFLDFECEACGAFYPLVEQMRERYDGELTFAIRYFPLEGHLNSRNAAHAVESAARQGRVEEMYAQMFATQEEWGDQQVDHSDTFRGFAEEIGLDMAQYDRDVVSEEVAQRVESDYQDALALGVSGTPSFFLDDEVLDPQSVEDFYAQIDAALGR